VDVQIEPHETLIEGKWQIIEGRSVADASALRIRALIDTELEKIGSTSGGWESLYRDRRDGRFWELFYPQGEMHGGGPESLRFIDAAEAAHKYGVDVMPPAPIKIDFAGMTTNERLYFAGLMPEWDAAAQSRNRERMVEILSRVGLGSQANEIAGAVLADPKRYGF
jgi:hypothetical protein